MNTALFTAVHNEICGDAWRSQILFVYSWCKIKKCGGDNVDIRNIQPNAHDNDWPSGRGNNVDIRYI